MANTASRVQRGIIESENQPYFLNWELVVGAGIVATSAATLMMYFIPPFVGLPEIDISTIIGTAMLSHAGPSAFWSGMAVHFIVGIIFTLVYAFLLMKAGRQSNIERGAIFGTLLWAAAMILTPFFMSLHPWVRSGRMSNPGFFLMNMNLGWRPAIFELGVYAGFGILVGGIYRHYVNREVARPAPRH